MKRLLRDRYELDRTASDVANQYGISEAELYRRQTRAIDLLAEALEQRESETLRTARAAALGRLEAPTYTRLIGVDDQIKELHAIVGADSAQDVVCISGLGGIGKTALADAVVRQLITDGRIWGLAWVTARQHNYRLSGAITPVAQPALSSAALVTALWNQLLPDIPLPAQPTSAVAIGELEERLKQFDRTVVVVDNLETVADLEDLLPMVRRLARPVRFLLTSREGLRAEPNLFHFSLHELSRPLARELIRSEARTQNLPHVATADDSTLDRIVDLVGGHPLALRLVVGQMHIASLEDVLRGLNDAVGAHAESLYTYIYWNAWHRLDETARNVLLAMPQLAPAGGALEFLVGVTGIPRPQLLRALADLIELSLVDKRGDLQTSRYSIHSLARTFLLNQVLHWQ
ncbi:MAG: ATP-binding protein [Anaerolineales bacterium]|nr:ATP-binding protein [Anaerolineales bacterium]